MQRRHRPSPLKSNSSRNSSLLLPTTSYRGRKDSSSHNRYRTSAVPLIVGSVLSLGGFVVFHYHTSSPIPFPKVDIIDNEQVNNGWHDNERPHQVNGHWEEWIVDDDGIEQHEHHVIDHVEVDDIVEFQKIEESTPDTEVDSDGMVQGKFFKIHKQHRTKEEATAAMLNVDSSNVDGEKKLKDALGKVVEDQKRGKNMNIEVISRWMGEDVPVIVSKNDNSEIKISDGIETEVKLSDQKDSNTTKKDKRTNSFPSPAELAGIDAKVILKPEFGEHRSDKNAVFAFAEGYDLEIYAGFIDSLLDTGFDGDIVLSVSAINKLKPEILEYLKSKPNLVVYTVKWDCFSKKGEAIDNANGGMSDCTMHGMFANSEGTEIGDPREPRPVATARYELYWAWSLHYDPHAQILLIDSRDTIFQRNPFDGITSSDFDAGILRLYGENAEATSLSISSFNKNWLIAAYGNEVFNPIKDKPVICSGSTAGEQIAIETYLRAMVQQFDLTKCKKKGCDQGFHNYLHYYNKLVDTSGIDRVVVYDQGKGAVNNLGAMKEKPLKEWGVLDIDRNLILNWDKSVSPVVHQVDRDNDLRMISNAKRKAYVKHWRELKR